MADTLDKMKFETPDLTSENIDKIAALFPGCVTEMRDEHGKLKRGINFEMLKQMLSPDVVDGDERYEFTWVGKKASIVEANKPIRKTLRPCPEESKNWDTTENLYIEGDNLEVLKLLQEAYLGKVKMIYIDPPYNTGNDFIYADDFMRSQEEENEQMGMYDEDENRLFKNTDSNGRFHSDWCSMMYSRLLVARGILTEDGVIFISIDNNEFSSMKMICDNVFGENSFVTALHVQMSTVQGEKVRAAKVGNIVKNGEFILVYSKNGKKDIGIRPLLDPVKYDNHYNKYMLTLGNGFYKEVNLTDILSKNEKIVTELKLLNLIPESGCQISSTALQEYYSHSPAFKKFVDDNAKSIIRVHDSIDIPEEFASKMDIDIIYEFNSDKRSYLVSKNKNGVITQRISLGEKLAQADDFYKTFGPTTIRGDWWSGFYLDMGNVSKEGDVNYDNGKKPVRLIRQLIEFCTQNGDIVMDFFAGSSTTAHAVMELCADDKLKRNFIMVQIDENLDESLVKATAENKVSLKQSIKFLDSIQKPHFLTEIGKERIRRVGEKIKEENPLTTQDLDVGFRVLKLDDSNMKDVYYAADDYDQQNLADMISNIKEDRTDLDLLFGCLLDWGVPLSMPYRSEQIDGCTVHTYNDGDLIACFDTNVPESVVKEIAKRKPLRAVFRDSSFADSPAKINVFEIFKLYMPEDANDISKRVRVI